MESSFKYRNSIKKESVNVKRYYFKIKNEWGKYLNLILNNINDDNFIWQLVDEEIFNNFGFLFNNKCNDALEVLSNNDFWNILILLK